MSTFTASGSAAISGHRSGLPEPQGLYHPDQEHDACGIGFVANIKGHKTHEIIEQGIQILINLTHRGACGCDPETGDGAGVLIQIPHKFFDRETRSLGFTLPEPGEYGIGMVFLPVERHQRLQTEGILERIVREEGLKVLGWRDTPIDGSAIGRVARQSQPYIEQIFIGPAPGSNPPMTTDQLERKLYIIRKRAEAEVADSDMEDAAMFCIPSLSARTIIYKGLLLAPQIAKFYKELSDPDLTSALCLVHQRFSTNTFPTWHLAHPFHYVAHNGEINTVKGNVNWMHARQSVLESELFGADLKKLFPIIQAGGSDSASFDNALELLVQSGRSLPHAMAMMIPEAWDNNPHMSDQKRAFYEYHCSLMEPWDGPAAITFTDGRIIGATLDRNGLRPARFLVTKDDMVVLSSETGVLPVNPEDVKMKGRLQPGKMFLVDLEEGRIVSDKEIKEQLAFRNPYPEWLAQNQITLDNLTEPDDVHGINHATVTARQRAFGYTDEDIRFLMSPMAINGEEPIGSMGSDTPLACLSDKPQPLFNYFKQLFAQVTNPPIDSIREEMVMSLVSYIGKERNILAETARHCHTLKLPHPVLTNRDLEKLRRVSQGDFLTYTLSALFPLAEGEGGLERALDDLCLAASRAIASGATILIISDRGVNADYVPIPSLLAMTAVHNHLVRESLRTQVALIVESGEPREVMHYALLIGYGASAVNPYLAIETLEDLALRDRLPAGVPFEKALYHYIKSVNKGLLKVFSKMGISTLQSYRGAQVFEAIGLNKSVIDRYFTGTASRIEGVGLDVLAREAVMKHALAFEGPAEYDTELPVGGNYAFRVSGEYHLLNPATVSKLQHAVQQNSFATFEEYAALIDEQNKQLCTIRGLLKFKPGTPVPLDEVEKAEEIVKRFATGAMSFGSISKEAHETIAIAMNRIGGRSNTGEGGEDESRFRPDPNGDLRRSSIKQVASGRFGVTAHYLVNADELQIKMAQGAKPGEGGQLPGHKVDEVIARVRHSVPGVGLISPPPHHDIYSIEDLAQLIYDLKNVNPAARISVKLVAEVGVGTVAAGVAKAHADVVLISGHDGGTGASPLTSLKHAGAPWELGLAETQQVLVMNDLRSRIRVQTDGKLQTGRDVAIAALLGAEEFGFSTMPLVALGCIMMRKCHLNTCPVGIATQDPVLRAKFRGQPEDVINFFFFIANQLREIMAQLGFRHMDEMIGRVDRLDARDALSHWKARGLDFSAILYDPPLPSRISRHCTTKQDHGLDEALDYQLIDHAREAIDRHKPMEITLPIRNIHRTVGAMLSGEIARKLGAQGLPDNTIKFKFTGSAGQSFGAFLARGVTLELEGDSNDYVGKGLSGGRIVVYPDRASTFVPEENILVGNVVLYGATSGEAFFNGMAGERFAVRNSGASTVVEGLGDHGCEYMTNGLVVVLGKTGRNFAAGMSGGIAYVLDEAGEFRQHRCNKTSVDLEAVTDAADEQILLSMINRHFEATGSPRAKWILEHWREVLPKFVKVFPHEFKRVLAKKAPAIGIPVLAATERVAAHG
ncbi:MAG TPA: glutamate synthase large subunit [Bryobacteraceae bacterium]|jgi:glutamate synthase domain-containing protein 2/glutamate synthase domain-containing protein 1/glutamate synthase domain-containing protein 3|nr:glutamate synthase large subunit [Bryobacteraceae bacterium]